MYVNKQIYIYVSGQTSESTETQKDRQPEGLDFSRQNSISEESEHAQRKSSDEEVKKGDMEYTCVTNLVDRQNGLHYRNAEEEREIMNAITIAQTRQRELGIKKNMELQWRMMQHDRAIPPRMQNGFSMKDMDSVHKGHNSNTANVPQPYTSTPKQKNGQILAHKYRYECTSCEIGYSDSVQYTDHMRYHDDDHPFKCKICGHCCRDKVDFCIHISRGNHS